MARADLSTLDLFNLFILILTLKTAVDGGFFPMGHNMGFHTGDPLSTRFRSSFPPPHPKRDFWVRPVEKNTNGPFDQEK
ncbi:hypothetical protein CHS0354_006584 [Potamilus streckersoni]|uniref:Uncharacterized protein n=1 Tax=Potamilus streckersoni TaxID=2493646 RepID=A0AAE0SWZ9_9BIVA|nr:hypothetical protein CHS0354_006584 [Potamilus streckersoni]